MAFLYDDENLAAYGLEDESVDIDLDQDEHSQGEVKSTVKHNFGGTVGKGYSASIRRLEEVHGSLDNGVEDDGSLLVLKVTPKTDSTKRMFKSFSVTLKLEGPPDGDFNGDPPSLAAFEPAADGDEYFQEKITHITQSRTLETGLSVKPPTALESTISHTSEVEKQFDQRRLLKLSAESHGLYPGIDTTVKFTLEPASQDEGIGDSLAIALIVKRCPGSNFYISVLTEAEVGFRARDLVSWKNRLHNSLRIGPFGPATSNRETSPPGVDKTNLQAASNQILKSLAYLHMPEKGTRKLFLDHSSNSVVMEDILTGSESHAPEPAGYGLSQRTSGSPAVETSQARNTGTARINSDQGVDDLAAQPMPSTEALGHKQIRVGQPLPISSHIERDDSLSQQQNRSLLAIQNSRAVRHRMMASLYRDLAQLHLDEAEEVEKLLEIAYTDKAMAQVVRF
ncbi:hypothetical protein CCMA1212_006896 [Trichoderma ghanense]|uniref:Uncharacterized protein n=1 Tax=Trichoderma ghanense TaxID=65468 RepID=A0ABY2H0Y9_9HYPO